MRDKNERAAGSVLTSLFARHMTKVVPRKNIVRFSKITRLWEPNDRFVLLLVNLIFYTR